MLRTLGAMHLTLEKSPNQDFEARIKITRKCVAPCVTSGIKKDTDYRNKVGYPNFRKTGNARMVNHMREEADIL